MTYALNMWNKYVLTKKKKKVSYASDICRMCQKQMPPEESKIYGCHYAKIVIYSEKTLRLYYDHWWGNVMDRVVVTEWAANFR